MFLRQGRVGPSPFTLRGPYIGHPVVRSNNALLSLPIRNNILQPGTRLSVFKGQSMSNYSTLNSRGILLAQSNFRPIYASSRPTILLPRARLAASLSTAAQRMLEERTNMEWPPLSDLANEGLHKMGDFAEMGLGLGWWPSDLMIRLLEFCHVSTNLPWWGSIALLTLILRISLFPIMLRTSRNMAIVPYIMDKQTALLEETKRARDSNQPVEMRRATLKLMDFYREWGYSPFVNFWGLLQIPIFFAMFRTCWRCSKLPVLGWQDGGTLWFTDLTAIDPYYILPAVSGVTTAFTIWMSQKDITTEPKGALGLFGALAPIMSIAFIPMLGAVQPASVFVYWTVNNFILLGQYVLFNNPRSREFLGIMPALPKESGGKQRRPGIKGLVLDRMDYIRLAFKNYIKEAEDRRRKFDEIGKMKGDIKYETRKKGQADKRARESGMVEKLK